ncbi:MAG: hypothetical protein WCI81_03540 [Chlorobiaceae bacterium]
MPAYLLLAENIFRATAGGNSIADMGWFYYTDSASVPAVVFKFR